MKTKTIQFFTFLTMVVVLGLQALLHGSWTVRETEPVRSDSGNRNRDRF